MGKERERAIERNLYLGQLVERERERERDPYLIQIVKELQDGEDAGPDEKAHLTPNVTWKDKSKWCRHITSLLRVRV